MDEKATLHELGKRIRGQRKSIGRTQEELAMIANVDRSYYGAIERGERNVGEEHCGNHSHILVPDLYGNGLKIPVCSWIFLHIGREVEAEPTSKTR